MVYPTASYDYLANYPNQYANQIADMTAEVGGNFANIWADPGTPPTSYIKTLMQYYIECIENGGPINDYPQNALIYVQAYDGASAADTAFVGLYMSQGAQVDQMCPVGDFQQPMLDLFGYWLSQ
jgi:hypothetical protein